MRIQCKFEIKNRERMAVKNSYSVDDLQKAIAVVQAGEAFSMRAAAHKYGIPPSTLHDHLKGKSKKAGAGGPSVLMAAEEREVAITCLALADMGFGLTRELVEVVLSDYLKDNSIPNPFTGGVPGKDWWQRFLKRWPSLAERKPQHLSKSRAEAGDKETIQMWFNKVEEVLTSAGLDPSDPATAAHLWNCDETAFSMSVSATKLLVRKGTKMVHEVGGGSGREYTTVHCAGSASGERLPPFILYKGKNLYRRWMEGGPAAAVYGISDSGWMDGANFLSWFTKLFLPAVSYLTKTAPVLLFLDGHHSHISLQLIKSARSNNVLLLCLPPNTTHLLQPLDVGVFAPVKSAWRAILKRYKLETKGQRVGKEDFPSLIAKLWDASFTPQQCKGGFRGAGLIPFSCNHVLQKLAPSAVLAHHDPANDPDDRQATTKITCTSCGHQMTATPLLKTRIVSYFSGILDVRTDGHKIGKRNNLKVRVEGEVITSDEFVTILEEQKASKEAEKQKKGKKREQKGGDIQPECEDCQDAEEGKSNIQLRIHMHQHYI